MDILNFISWIKGGRYTTTPPANSVTVIGAPSSNRDDKYLPVTIPLSALGSTGISNVGRLIGGGIVVAEWDDNGVKKVLIASLQDLSINVPWTIAPYTGIIIGASAQSYSNGLTNTNAIIAQTGSAPTTAYAAGLAKLYLGGGYNDWYLPSQWELNMCYQSAGIVTKVLGTANGFSASNYWCSTEFFTTDSFTLDFQQSFFYPTAKSFNNNVRAVRIHTL